MTGGELSNAIGARGEAIFESIMTKFHGILPLFRRPIHLGEKWPSIDYVCELIGPWKTARPFFFVQVKTTKSGYTRVGRRLKVGISKKRARALTFYKVPVYLVGVDAESEQVYIVGASGRVGGLSSMHTGTKLDVSGRRKLWNEVREFWTKVPRSASWTDLKEPLWK
jgi:hypothetical protein